jgi:hypothetical protein
VRHSVYRMKFIFGEQAHLVNSVFLTQSKPSKVNALISPLEGDLGLQSRRKEWFIHGERIILGSWV